ncbi:uncharacterized protein N7484_001723 [Penicillium longicatenatum]|uniref:uncharacterized protein n=1 Tax=Penicillium longicatenatum TaxID=1561947 RepID=UPI0025480358|nr:uncharacterized protein N7484_001723 [Penicillium longicatenatum]KAJ5658074.1 hypothetical protein N7484_001723 [Penicillium longicatenatum]
MLRLRHLFRSQARPFRFHSGPRESIHTTPTVRHVRFRRPWLRSFFSKCLLYGAAYQLWSSFVLVRFDDDTHDIDAPESTPEATGLRRSPYGGEELLEDEEEIGAPLFVPLTWSWLEEGKLYTASDPEWQEFVQISKDREKLKSLRDELAAIVRDSASGQLSQILGSPLSLTGFWLVHQFPHRAPPEYLRSGIEITDNGVAWVTRPIDSELGDKVQTFMKPIHVALAIKDAYLVLLGRQLARFRGDTPHALESFSQRRILSNNENFSSTTSHEQPSLRPAMPEETKGNISSNGDNELHPSSIISSLQRLPLPDLGPGSDLHLASLAFRLRLNEYQTNTPRTPIRGTFFISGPVGLKGPNGFCRFEVRGEYDPSKSGWRTVEMSLRDVNLRKQKPLGGR